MLDYEPIGSKVSVIFCVKCMIVFYFAFDLKTKGVEHTGPVSKCSRQTFTNPCYQIKPSSIILELESMPASFLKKEILVHEGKILCRITLLLKKD